MLNAKEKEKQFVSVKYASILTGLDKQTIRKFFDNKKINGYKTPTGQRRIDRQGLQAMCCGGIDDETIQVSARENFLYARVSTKKQLDDLARQVEYLKRSEYADYTLIQDIGSGINFKRKGLQTILDSCIQRNVGEVVVAHRDRLSRFAFDLIHQLITKAGGTLTVLNCDRNKSSEYELAEDLLSIIHIFNCRQMGKRSYKRREKEKIIQDSENQNFSRVSTDRKTE